MKYIQILGLMAAALNYTAVLKIYNSGTNYLCKNY
jgi:hypothetical protein